jgi:hypothetical protein
MVLTPFVIPLAAFLFVVIIVCLTSTVKLRDKEMEIQQRLHLEELDHRSKMQELESRLQEVKARR